MKSVKVVYNSCYGGWFSLSRAAVLRAREISGNPKWGGATIQGDNKNGRLVDRDYGHCPAVKRTDPALVQVVEELGDEANGSHAKLFIAEVSAPYRIDEYDGYESVVPPRQSWY